MALSSLSFTAFAGAGPYPIHNLDYLDTAHLSVTVDGTPVTATFDDARKTMTLAVAPAAGAEVVVLRTTPRLREERLTQFFNLATGQAGLTGALLDQDARQNMLILQEGRDHLSGDAIPEGAMGLDLDGEWGGESLKIENVTTAVEATDAVTKAQLDTVDAAARPLPIAVLDNDDGLMVVAGEWDDKAPAGFRTALGLGSAALLTAGNAANQVPSFAAGTPPLYPTVDGRNIDLSAHAIQAEILKRSLATVVNLFHATAISSNNIDPTAGTWSQSAGSRIGSLSVPFTNRIELNNSSDVAFNSAPQFFTLSAGTWRIRWISRSKGPAGVFDPFSVRITNDDDTGSQVIYYDSGVFNLLKQPAASNIQIVHSDEILLAFGGSSKIVFRFACPNLLGTAHAFRLHFHKISTSSSLS